MKKNILLTCVLFLCLVLICSCDEPQRITPSGKKIKIGVIAPLSGDSAAQGEDGVEGLRAAQKVQPLLSNGAEIEFVFADDKNDPNRIVAALSRLAGKEKVAAIIVFSDSVAVLAMEPFADRYQTPVIVTQATHPDISKKSKYVTQLCFDDVFQGSVAALFVRDELLIDNVAIFNNSDNPYSVRLAREFRQKFVNTGGKITGIISVPETEEKLYAEMDDLRNKKTQLLYMPIKAQCLIHIVNANMAIGWSPKMMCGDGLLASVLSRFGGDVGLLDGLMATEFFGDRVIKTDYGKKLRKAHSSFLDGLPTTFSALGAEAYGVLLDTLNRCHEPDNRQEINEKLRQTTDFNGISGKISISAAGKAKRSLFVDKIENGSLEKIVKVY